MLNPPCSPLEIGFRVGEIPEQKQTTSHRTPRKIIFLAIL